MKKFLPWLLALLFVTAVYEYAWPTPTIHYYVFVVLHVAAGLILLGLCLLLLRKIWRDSKPAARVAWSLLCLGGITGFALIFTGALRNDFLLLYVHIGACVVGIILLLGNWVSAKNWRITRFEIGRAHV